MHQDKKKLNLKGTTPTKPLEALDSRIVDVSKVDWKFCSDHLPCAIDVSIAGEDHRVVSWNVLNEQFIDKQRVYGTFPEQERDSVSRLTNREAQVLRKIFNVLEDSRVSVVCLQECSRELLKALTGSLSRSHGLDGQQFEVISSLSSISSDQEVTIFNVERLGRSQSRKRRIKEERTYLFKTFGTAPHSLLDLTLYQSSSGHSLRIINAHVPAAVYPKEALRYQRELLEYLNENPSKESTATIVIGDLNIEPAQLTPLITSVASNQFELPAGGYRTHVDFGSGLSRVLDYAFVSPGALGKIFSACMANSAEDVMEGLVPWYSLLNE